MLLTNIKVFSNIEVFKIPNTEVLFFLIPCSPICMYVCNTMCIRLFE